MAINLYDDLARGVLTAREVSSLLGENTKNPFENRANISGRAWLAEMLSKKR